MKQQYEEELKSGQVKIEWMNENVESGLPYDFRIRRVRREEFRSDAEFSSTTASGEPQDDDDVIAFIEVKSTRKAEQESFPISYQELLFAQKYASKFEVYRLYCAGGNGLNHQNTQQQQDPQQLPRLKVIQNLSRLLYTHGLNLFIVI